MRANFDTGSQMSDAARAMVHLELAEAVAVHEALAQNAAIAEQLTKWASQCVDGIRSGGSVIFAGNGGSFADAQHLAAELTGKMGRARESLPGIALGTNSSSMTSIGNDFNFDQIFARECRALARPGSVVVALSTSGNSSNILSLAKDATSLGLTVYGLTGADGGQLAGLCETIRVPSKRTERIQEMHILLGHTLCLLIEEALVFSRECEHPS